MKDWLKDRIGKDAQKNIDELKNSSRTLWVIIIHAWNMLSNNKYAEEAIIEDDKESYHQALDVLYRGAVWTVVVYGIWLTLSSIFIGGMDNGSFYDEALTKLALFIAWIIGTYFSYYSLAWGLKFWNRPEELSGDRLFHIFVALLAPYYILIYIVGSVVAFIDSLIFGGPVLVVHSIFELVIVVLFMASLSSIIKKRYGLPRYKTCIAYFVGFLIIFAIMMFFILALVGLN